MTEQPEPTLTDADREQWRLHVAGERAWLAKYPDFPLCHAILAVAERLVWLEAERERLYASDETNQERVMHILGIVDGLKSEREQLVRERDEARAEVEQMHARADHATAELLALGRELQQAREENARLREAEWVICGSTYQDQEAERITEALRETEGFATRLGCQRRLKMKYAFRCAECGRWFDRECIVQHFATHATREAVQTESDQPNDYYIYGNIKVQERAYYLITELGGKLTAAEGRIKESAAERDHAVAEAAVLRRFIQASEVLEYAAAAVVRQPLNDVTPIATYAAAVLAVAGKYADRLRAYGNHVTDTEDALVSAVDAYRAVLAGESEVPHG